MAMVTTGCNNRTKSIRRHNAEQKSAAHSSHNAVSTNQSVQHQGAHKVVLEVVDFAAAAKPAGQNWNCKNP
jgi:hypothetical protein